MLAVGVGVSLSAWVDVLLAVAPALLFPVGLGLLLLVALGEAERVIDGDGWQA
jgi:hypothetical protein